MTNKREHGYRVTITGFLPVDPKNLLSQKAALDALTGGYADLVPAMKNVTIDQRMTSREIDEAGNPVPRGPRKPRAAKGKK